MPACKHCDQTRPSEAFCKDARSSSGITSTCKQCSNRRQRESVERRRQRQAPTNCMNCGEEFRPHPDSNGVACSRECWYEYNRGEDHPQYRQDASYSSIHSWLGRNREKSGTCVYCGEAKPTEWANVSGNYNRLDEDDWLELCAACHARYDRPYKTRCVNGHEMTEENTYIRPDRPDSRSCRTCRREAVRKHYNRRKSVCQS